MNKLSPKRMGAVLLAAALAAALIGCAQKQTTEPRDFKAEAMAANVYCVPKVECFLCGNGGEFTLTEHLGQNNVGIISLNSFEVMPVEVNRYDDGGALIESNTGVMSMWSFKSESEGFSASLSLDADRGIANIDISPHNDADLDLSKTAQHLCVDCLNDLVSSLYRSAYGIGIIDFDTRRLYAFQENTTAFSAGDYYIHRDIDSKYDKIQVLIVYCPLRYSNRT